MGEETVKVPFTSSPEGRAVKTLVAGVAGYILANAIPVLNTLPNHELFMPFYGAIVSWIGRYFKNKGIDLGAI